MDKYDWDKFWEENVKSEESKLNDVELSQSSEPSSIMEALKRFGIVKPKRTLH